MIFSKSDFIHILNDFIHLCWGLTSQSTILQSCRDGATASWVINQYFRGVKCLAQGHNTAAVGFEPRTSCSGVRHSTTEPPRSPDFIHEHSPRTRAENPLGTNFWCQQKALISLTICCKFQTNLFKFWLYTNSLMFFHMYIAPGQGQTTFCGKILMSTERPCHFVYLLQV